MIYLLTPSYPVSIGERTYAPDVSVEIVLTHAQLAQLTAHTVVAAQAPRQLEELTAPGEVTVDKEVSAEKLSDSHTLESLLALSREELRDLCRSTGVSTAGSKEEMAARLLMALGGGR